MLVFNFAGPCGNKISEVHTARRNTGARLVAVALGGHLHTAEFDVFTQIEAPTVEGRAAETCRPLTVGLLKGNINLVGGDVPLLYQYLFQRFI